VSEQAAEGVIDDDGAAAGKPQGEGPYTFRYVSIALHS
jgi:hypothetical protein